MTNPTAACPIMSEEEREVIGAGLRQHMEAMRKFFIASDDIWRAQVDALPKKLRDEVYAASRAQSAAMRQEDRIPHIPLWDWLWTAIEGDRMTSPTARDAIKASAEILARYGRRATPPLTPLRKGEGERTAPQRRHPASPEHRSRRTPQENRSGP